MVHSICGDAAIKSWLPVQDEAHPNQIIDVLYATLPPHRDGILEIIKSIRGQIAAGQKEPIVPCRDWFWRALQNFGNR